MSNKTIEDVMICPECGSLNCHEYSTDEVEFSAFGPHYYVDCACADCKKNFRLCFEFEYNITKSWIRK